MLTDGDDRFSQLVMRLRASQLKRGQIARSENGRMDLGEVWQVREGYKNVSGVVLSTTNQVILTDAGAAASIDLIASTGPNATASGTTTVTVDTTTDGNWISADPGHTILLNLSGFTGGAGTLDGNRVATWVSNTSFTVSAAGVSGSWTGGTVGPVKLSDDPIEIYGACLFSDPSDSNNDYIIIADNAQATAIKLSDLSKINISYPAGETLTQNCDLIQEFGTVVLRQDGATSWEWDGDTGGSLAFTKVASGAKTANDELAGTPTIATTGKVSLNIVGHGLVSGNKVVVIEKDTTELTNGDSYIVTRTDDDNFHFFADIDDAGTGAASLILRKKVSLGGGYVNMPAAPWGIYHQRRAWVPYFYDSAASPADRGVRDEIIASDILDNKTFDPIGNQFRITAGTADFVVGLQGFDDDRLIVFNRNSIHYLKGISGSLNDVETIQLTDEIGCVSRKSIIQYSNQVLFLSDSGIYAISFLDEYNLRGTDLPLSEAVQPIIDRITPGAADQAIGIYHDNRAWFALPLDGNEFPSHILLYNFLTRGWESLDRPDVEGTAWCVEELIAARTGKINRLYAVTTFGGVHQLDGTGLSRDQIAPTVGQSTETIKNIPGILETRQYTFGDMRRKKFQVLRAHLKSAESSLSQGDLDILVEDPDTTVAVGEIRDEFSGGLAADEDGTYHRRIGNVRGNFAQFRFTNESGRPSIRAVQIDAVSDYESVTSLAGAAGGATT